MQESTFYQAIVQEVEECALEQGRQEGRQEGRIIERFRLLRKIVPLLQGWGISIAPIFKNRRGHPIGVGA